MIRKAPYCPTQLTQGERLEDYRFVFGREWTASELLEMRSLLELDAV
jgi:hypothetical protein